MRILVVILLFLATTLHGFDRVVLWGYKLHTHTHSYIHHAFYRAFKHLGYEVHWFDDRDKIDEEAFANSLFITNLGAEKNIPLREDCEYILHTHWWKDFSALDTKFGPWIEKGHCIVLKCFHDDFLDDPEWENIAPCTYRNIERREIAIPWATDLLPHEIEKEKRRIANIKQVKRVAYIGTISGGSGAGANWRQLTPFFTEAKKNGYTVLTNSPWKNPLPMHKVKRLLQESTLSPAIQGAWQVKVGYIPCRIFKNLSYGCLGITNSYRVWELFDKKIVYDPDTVALLSKAEEALEEYTLEKRFAMMDLIKDQHTYLNRIEVLLEFLEKVK